jgi:GNAT superfamily N-acetyltransferase
MIVIRRMDPAEITRIGEIDRSERIDQQYRAHNGVLELIEVDIDAHPWGGEREHPVQHYIDRWKPVVEADGVLVGALDADRLAGFAVYDPSMGDGTGNLAAAFTNRAHRRSGVGRALVAEIIAIARERGDRHLYVSATPTRGTVDFYRSQGFEVLGTPDPVMFANEPEDIHLAMTL